MNDDKRRFPEHKEPEFQSLQLNKQNWINTQDSKRWDETI